MTSDFIRDVSFTCKVGKEGKNELFGYIANDERLGVMNCHVFRLPEGTNKQITKAVQEAFRVAAEQEKLVKEEEEEEGRKNERMKEGGKREAVNDNCNASRSNGREDEWME